MGTPPGGISRTPIGYFANAAEADGWLDFDSNDEERERAAYAENDRYTEWQRWQAAWAAGEV